MIKIKSTTKPNQRLNKPYSKAVMGDIINFWSKKDSFFDTELYIQILKVKNSKN
jgi:hypothetical protein